MTTSEAGCPVTRDFRFVGVGAVPDGFERYDRLQDEAPIWKVEEPGGSYWMVLDRALALRGLQDTATFSSSAITPLEPEPAVRMKPIQLDPPEHVKWRKMLASYFSPRRMPLIEQRILAQCTLLLDRIVPTGECELIQDFAEQFPTVIFLEIVGLPVEELPEFLEWERKMLHPAADGVVDRQIMVDTMFVVMGRLMEAVAERRAHPDPDAEDIISHAAAWEIDGEPVADSDILECCLLLFLAGLDTVANELAFAFHHLATHSDDRKQLARAPETAPAAVEELLRAYSIPQLARKVTRDTEFGGARLSEGDMVLFSLSAANRDPGGLANAREVVLSREPGPHYAFGAGPHRCLGSHLARQEMTIALREWHRRIPEYELATTEPIVEYRGSVHGIVALPLRWQL